MAKKTTLLTLWLIVIVYLLSIDLKGVWTDEGDRLRLLSGGQSWEEFNRTGSFGTFSDVITAIGPTFYQPLFYLIDNAVIRLARSRSEVLLRIVNVLWLLLAAQGLLRFFRTYPPWTRLFGILILAFNGYMLMHVMQIREYPMYLAFMVWSSCLYFEVLETPGPPPLKEWWRLLVANGVWMALLFYCHVNCMFVFAAQAIMLLTRKENRPAFFRALTVSYGVAAALALPWLNTIYVRFPNKVNPGVFDHRAPTLSLLIDSMLLGFRSLLTYNTWTGYPLMQAFGILVLAGIPVAWFVTMRRGESMDRRSVYALLTMVLFALFQIAYFFRSQPLSIWHRYFMAYYFGYTVMTTCAFAVLERAAWKTAKPLWKAAAAGVFLLVCATGATQVKLFRQDPYMDTGMSDACNWRVVTRAMIQHIRPEETIAYYYPLQTWTMSVYYPFYTHTTSYGDILGGKPPGVASLWILDTSVMQDYLHQTMTKLESLRYRQTKSVELGCQCKLFKYELTDVATNVHPDPGQVNGK